MLSKTWTATCLAVLVSMTMAGPAAGADPSRDATIATRAVGTSNFDVWSYNLSGAATTETDGTINNGGSTRANAPVNQLLDDGGRPDMIALQEVCHNQLISMNAKLSGLGYTAYWSKTRTQERCTRDLNGNPQVAESANMYDVVAVPTSYGPTGYHYDVDPSTPPGHVPGAVGDGLTCLLFTKSGKQIVGCSTQISGDEATRRAKTRLIRNEQVIPWLDPVNDFGIVIAGDFNSEPTSKPASESPMNWMYSSLMGGTAKGHLFDAGDTFNSSTPNGARTGRWTNDGRSDTVGRRKIDYIFMSNNVFKPRTFVPGYVDKPGYSYHTLFTARSDLK